MFGISTDNSQKPRVQKWPFSQYSNSRYFELYYEIAHSAQASKIQLSLYFANILCHFRRNLIKRDPRITW